jgi:hypothetical protein
MEASSLLTKPPTAAASLAFEGIEAGSEEGGGFWSPLGEESG